MTYREEIARIYQQEGGLRGFTQGYRAMALRDILSFGSYFMIYDLFKGRWSPSSYDNGSKARERKGINIWLLFAGGLSGVLAWSLGFPLDSLKLRMQTSPSLHGLGLIASLKVLHQTSPRGLLDLFNGLHV
jgi:hypothetical protein